MARRRTDEPRIPCDPTRVDIGRRGGWRSIPDSWRGFTTRCGACDLTFTVSAEEQRFWYEDLGIPLSVEINRCPDCRRKARNQRRIIARLSELMPRLKQGTATHHDERAIVLSIVEGARLRLPRDVRLVSNPGTLEQAIAIAGRLIRDDPLQADLLPAVIELHAMLGNERAAIRCRATLERALEKLPALERRVRLVRAWLDQPTRAAREALD